jgi:hypothetical protein
MNRSVHVIFPVILTLLVQAGACASDFEESLKSLGLVFNPPKDYQVVPPKENRDVKYDYALRHPTKKYEVRYALHLLPKGALEKYQEWSKKKDKGGTIKTDPNLLPRFEFQAVAQNIAGEDRPVSVQQLKEAEFGADAEQLTLTQTASEFAGDFKYCAIIGIQKKDWGQVYIFHLFDDFNDVKEEMNAAYFSLKFATEKHD